MLHVDSFWHATCMSGLKQSTRIAWSFTAICSQGACAHRKFTIQLVTDSFLTSLICSHTYLERIWDNGTPLLLRRLGVKAASLQKNSTQQRLLAMCLLVWGIPSCRKKSKSKRTMQLWQICRCFWILWNMQVCSRSKSQFMRAPPLSLATRCCSRVELRRFVFFISTVATFWKQRFMTCASLLARWYQAG